MDKTVELNSEEIQILQHFAGQIEMARASLTAALVTIVKLRGLNGNWTLSPDGKALIQNGVEHTD